MTPQMGSPGDAPFARLLVIGAVGGLFSGLFGIGGGIILLPLLMWWAGMDFLRASATSLGVIVPIAAIAAIPYLVFGQVSWWMTLCVAVASILGAQLGLVVRRSAPTTALELGFAVFLLGISTLLLVVGGSRETLLTPQLADIAVLLAIGFAGGLSASVFGAGGGVFLVPLLLVAGAGDLIAKSASLLSLIAASLIPSLIHLRRRTTSFSHLVPVALAGIVCGPIGAVAAQYLPPVVTVVTISAIGVVFAGVSVVRVVRRSRRK